MSKKISELETTTLINNDDIFVISQSPEFNDSKQITKENIFADTEAEIKNSLGTDEYDSTSTYATGDYCIYDNTLYKCSTAINTPEDFNSNHWTEIRILEEIDEIKENANLKENIITAGLSANHSVTTLGNQDLLLTAEISKVGNKLSLSNGGIIIGSGINHVLISGHFYINVGTNTGAKNFYVKLNDTEILLDMNTVSASNSNVSRALAPKLISVSENDVIKCGIYANIGDTVNSANPRNYITVQVVD